VTIARTQWVGLLTLGLAGLGCTDRQPAGPALSSVRPDRGRPPLELAVLGQAFHPRLLADYDDPQRSRIGIGFEVQVGSATLSGLQYIGAGELRGALPSGLAPGVYDVVVTDPWGRRATLANGFTVVGAVVDAGPEAGAADAGVDLPADGSVGDGPGVDLGDMSVDSGVDAKLPPHVVTAAGSGVPGAGNGPVAAAQFNNPAGVAVGGGKVYVGDHSNHLVRMITPGDAVGTLAGNGQAGYTDGPAAQARFNLPMGVALAPDGALIVADSSNHVIRRIHGGTVSTLAGAGAQGYQDGAAGVARFNFPQAVAVDGAKVYVADSDNHRVRMIEAGQVTTIAGGQGFADGALGLARFDNPRGLALDGSSKIYVADSGNHRIRLIDRSVGQVSTVAGDGQGDHRDGPAATARFWNPADVAVHGARIYVADQANHVIRLIEAGNVTTLNKLGFGDQDGLLSVAQFNYPRALAVGPDGELYVADQTNHRIRVIIF